MTAEDLITVINGFVPIDLDALEFCVITGTDRPGGSWWPFEKGEVLVLDKLTGREPWGDGRKPAKWSVDTEYVGTLEEAKAIRDRVLSVPGGSVPGDTDNPS